MKESRIVVWAHHGVFPRTSAEDALIIEVQKSGDISEDIHLPILPKRDSVWRHKDNCARTIFKHSKPGKAAAQNEKEKLHKTNLWSKIR